MPASVLLLHMTHRWQWFAVVLCTSNQFASVSVEAKERERWKAFWLDLVPGLGPPRCQGWCHYVLLHGDMENSWVARSDSMWLRLEEERESSGWSCSQSQMLELQGPLHPLLGSSFWGCSAWHGHALSPAGNRQPGWGAQRPSCAGPLWGTWALTPKKHYIWHPGPHQLGMDHLGVLHQ